MSKSDEYKVGYKRPPKHKQFQKGKSGNALGRPRRKKQPEPLPDCFSNELLKESREKITVTENGKSHQITKRRALARRMMNGAVMGDVRAQKLVMEELRYAEDRQREGKSGEILRVIVTGGLPDESP